MRGCEVAAEPVVCLSPDVALAGSASASFVEAENPSAKTVSSTSLV